MLVLSQKRRERNMTQQQLADSVKITRQMISAVEKGATPSVKIAKKLSEVLGIPWTSFFDDEPQAQEGEG